MVMGLHKAYRCKECGAVFLKSENGKPLLLSDNDDNASRPRSDRVSKPLVILKNLLGLVHCPQCASLKVFEEIGIRT